ncbi:hypothetical protein ACOBR2_20135 [Telmatobacter bradus]|uniref:hypothetical protein n=1 Tax=Telmatobacter bradus TaxID=474953 RepID=UPI003B42F367
MQDYFLLFCGSIFGAVVLFLAVRKGILVLRNVWNAGKFPAILWSVFSLLFLVGYLGCFTQWSLGMGAFLPGNVEWPIRSAVNALPLQDGSFAVPLQAVGRVQIYDGQWRFVRGWQVPAQGRSFRLDVMLDGAIRVINRRQQVSFYSEGGQVMEARSHAPLNENEPIGALPLDLPVRITTNPLLLLFASRFASWSVAAFGALGAFLIGRLARDGSR